jgi:hypothetical protein
LCYFKFMADKTSTATKVAIGAGAVALLGGLLSALGKKAPVKAKPVSGCGRCGR